MGVVGLAPVVQTMVVAVELETGQSMPSMVTVGPVPPRLVPVRVRVYPPAMSPYLGLIEVTIAVASCLYSTLLEKV